MKGSQTKRDGGDLRVSGFREVVGLLRATPAAADFGLGALVAARRSAPGSRTVVCGRR